MLQMDVTASSLNAHPIVHFRKLRYFPFLIIDSGVIRKLRMGSPPYEGEKIEKFQNKIDLPDCKWSGLKSLALESSCLTCLI